MAAPVAQAKGAYAVGTTSFVADVPAGIQADDILLIVMESCDTTSTAGTPNTPADWTKLFEEAQGVGSAGATTLTIFAKVATGSEIDVTVDGVGNHCSGTMFAIRGASPVVGDILVGTGAGGNGGNPLWHQSPTTTVDDCLLLACGCYTRNIVSSAQWSNWLLTDVATPTEWEDNQTDTGFGGGIGVAWDVKATAGVIGLFEATLASAANNRLVALAFPPPSAGGLTATIGLATETHTAQALVGAHALALGLATETDSAQLLATAKAVPIALATESDLAQALTAARVAALTRAIETNTAQAILAARLAALGLATETDLAQALASAKTVVLGRATETDTALAITALLLVVLTGKVSVGNVRLVRASADARHVRATADARIVRAKADARSL